MSDRTKAFPKRTPRWGFFAMRLCCRLSILACRLITALSVIAAAQAALAGENPYAGQNWAMVRYERSLTQLFGDMRQWNTEGASVAYTLIIAVRVTDGTVSPETQVVLWVGGWDVMQARVKRARSRSIFAQLVQMAESRLDWSDTELFQTLQVDTKTLESGQLAALKKHITAFGELRQAVLPEPTVVPYSPKIEVWAQSWASLNYFRIWAPPCTGRTIDHPTGPGPLHAWCAALFKALDLCGLKDVQ